MSLSAGTKLGPYEILGALGAGGMGEVWRARDTRLDRQVAIKVLPEAFLEDKERRSRFEREAKALAAVNHANIATVHSFEEISGRYLIVQELLEGQSLREHLRAGRLPPRRATRIAVQIAAGLAAAHEKGIVHRDLKPENVSVAPDGRVRILDFGLARQTPLAAGDDTKSPTLELGTDPHTILGTVGYMSPEQVRGRPVDHRSDIFSFGCVLYEMLSGTRAFKGASPVETMSAIVLHEPPDLPVAAGIPPALDRIVRHCLEKSPSERFQSARDVAFDLETLSEVSTSSVSGVPVSRSRQFRRLFLVGAGVAAALVLGILWGRRTAPVAFSPGDVSFRRLTFRRGNIQEARFAPDGKTVVYGAQWEGKPLELFSVRTDSLESRSLGLRNAGIASISSKGDLAIVLGMSMSGSGSGTLARVPLGGGAPREIADDISTASWSPDGNELAVVPNFAGGRSRLEYPIGKTLYESASELLYLNVSPKGDLVATTERTPGGGFLVVVDRAGKARRVSGPWANLGPPVWRPDGQSLVFMSGAHGIKTEIREASLAGMERVIYKVGDILQLWDALPDGRMLVERYIQRGGISLRPPGEERERDYSWLDHPYRPILSADGTTVVFTERGEGGGSSGSVFLWKIGAEAPVHLGEGRATSLSRDGKWVSARIENELALLPTGPGAPRRITLPGLTLFSGSILPDGRTLWIWASESGKSRSAWTLPIEGGAPTRVLTEYPDGGETFLPDGKTCAFHIGGGKGFLMSIDSGQRTPLKGLEPGDQIVEGAGDMTHIFVYRPEETPGKIVRIEIATGRRELWKTLMPADPAGIYRASDNVTIARDERSYAYSYRRVVASDLYILEGVR